MTKITTSFLILFNVLSMSTKAESTFDFNQQKLQKEFKKLGNIAIDSTVRCDEYVAGKYQYISRNSTKQIVYVGRVFCCRVNGCTIKSESADNSNREFFDYFILFDSVAKIEKIVVFDYQATHGHEVGLPGWLKQFKAYDGVRNLTLGKNIDAISGATISAEELTKDIVDKTRLLQKLTGIGGK